MAERDRPPPIPTSPPPTPPAEAPDPQASADPVDPKPVRTSGTYIVQVPKDQIYRVPPPENAYLAERYRKPQERRRRCCCCRSSWCFGAVVLAGLLFLAGAAASYFLARTPSPSFSVKHLRVERHHAAAAARYAFDVGVRNLASTMGWFSLGGGSAVLSYSGSNVASGKMPSFYQGPKGQRTITLDLSGAGSAQLPAEVKTRTKGKRPKGGDLTLSLTMVFPVKKKLGILGTSTAVARVSCSVKVNTLAEGTSKVLEQSCKYSEV